MRRRYRTPGIRTARWIGEVWIIGERRQVVSASPSRILDGNAFESLEAAFAKGNQYCTDPPANGHSTIEMPAER